MPKGTYLKAGLINKQTSGNGATFYRLFPLRQQKAHDILSCAFFVIIMLIYKTNDPSSHSINTASIKDPQ
jgi:hypothetical protein